MIYCGECGAQNDEERERCASCGASLALPLVGEERDDGAETPHPRAGRRTPRTLLFAGLGVVALLAAFGSALVASRPDRSPEGSIAAGTPGVTPGAPDGTARAAASPSPSSPEAMGRIAFSGFFEGREQDRDLYATSADGGGEFVRLTNVPGFDGQPSWSPTGEQLAFASERGKIRGKRPRQIWVMDADGANPRRVTSDPNEASYPDWSPDGAWIAYEGGAFREADIFRIPVRGGELVQLTDNRYRETAPAWSPDGKRIAFMGLPGRYWQIFVMEADGSGLRQLTRTAGDHRFPRWSPDGGSLYFNTRTGPTSEEVGQIYRVGLDGEGRTQITSQRDGRNGRPFPSPDGRFIAFNSDRADGNFEIYVSRADGSDPRRLTSTTTDDYEPAWSPTAGGG